MSAPPAFEERGPGRRPEANTVAPALPRFTTTTGGSGSAARIASAPTIPHASSASSSPTKTRSHRRASSSSTPASPSRHSRGRWFTSNDTSGRPGRGAVSSRSRARQSAESAAVIPDRCRMRPANSSSYGTFAGDIADAADPAR